LLEPAWKEVNKTLSYRENVYNPEKNLETSLRYLKSLKIALKSINPEFEKLSKQEKLKHIITAYNWGIGKFQEANFNLNKVPAETKNFFKKLGLN
jgi:membrane-bound lytic murein transglycosylase MltF